MPFKSEAQRRFFYAKASEPGEEGKAFKKHLKKMRASTPEGVKLPERVKTAGKKRMTVEQLIEHARRIDPVYGPLRVSGEDSLKDKLRAYRSILRTGGYMGAPEKQVPLSIRLRRYKRWKKAGTSGGADDGVMRVRRDATEPVVVFSGMNANAAQSIKNTRQLRTRLDKKQYIPGRPSLTNKGLYATPDLGYAARYDTAGNQAGRAQEEKARLEGTIMRFEIPAKDVKYMGQSDGKGSEAFLTDRAIRNAKIDTLPSAEAKRTWSTKTASQDAFEFGFFAEMSKIAEDSLTDRALFALPGMGALIGGTAGALHPDAFSPKEIFPKYIKRVGLRSPQGRAMSAALGAGTAATLGWLPAAMRDAYRAVKPRPKKKKKDRRG
jgi:hypothetical protein